MRGDHWVYEFRRFIPAPENVSYARRRHAPAGRELVKIVMLVDNGVDGDSRVQKTARSAADAGWDVTLLGCSPTAAEQRWRIGAAQVRLLPMGGGAPRAAAAALVACRRRAPGCSAGRSTGVRVRYWQRRLRRPGLAAARTRAVELRAGLRPGDRRAGAGSDPRARLPDARRRRPGRRGPRPPAGRSSWSGTRTSSCPAPRRGGTTRAGCPRTSAYEREYVPSADAVVTVSDTLAELLQRRARPGRAAGRGAERARGTRPDGRRGAGSARAVRRRPRTPRCWSTADRPRRSAGWPPWSRRCRCWPACTWRWWSATRTRGVRSAR